MWLSLLTDIHIDTYRKTKLYDMILCLYLKLIPGHGVVVQSIISKGIANPALIIGSQAKIPI